jgi:cytochrome c biogenesis protein CcmG, thiol:disulfide interchange protein DsbE
MTIEDRTHDGSIDQTSGVSTPFIPDYLATRSGTLYVERKGRRSQTRLVLAVCAFTVAILFTLVLAKGLGGPKPVESPLLGKFAPSFDLTLFDRNKADIGKLRETELAGRIYIINFWASWCVPCREEAPVLEAFAKAHSSDQGVVLIGISYSDELSDAQTFLREFDVTYPQLRDPTGRAAVDYGVRGIPETFVIDQQGVIKAKLIGALTNGSLDSVVAAVAIGETVTAKNGRYQSR